MKRKFQKWWSTIPPIPNYLDVSSFTLVSCVMRFNATFNNMSVTSWQSVLLMEITGGPEETHRHATSHWYTLSHNVVSGTSRHGWGLELTTLVVESTNCTCRWKSNYNTNKTTTAPYGIHVYETIHENIYVSYYNGYIGSNKASMKWTT